MQAGQAAGLEADIKGCARTVICVDEWTSVVRKLLQLSDVLEAVKWRVLARLRSMDKCARRGEPEFIQFSFGWGKSLPVLARVDRLG